MVAQRTAQSALHLCSAVPLYAACPGKPGTTGTTGDGHGQGWCDMGEGRHGRARRGKGREGAKNDASASLSAKAAAWFLTRMAESHPPLLCSVALLHSTPLHSPPLHFLPACQRCKAMDNRDAIRDFCTSTGTTAVPRQSHCSTTPAHTASLAPLHCCTACYRNRNGTASRTRASKWTHDCAKRACLWEVCAPKQYCNHHTRT